MGINVGDLVVRIVEKRVVLTNKDEMCWSKEACPQRYHGSCNLPSRFGTMVRGCRNENGSMSWAVSWDGWKWRIVNKGSKSKIRKKEN